MHACRSWFIVARGGLHDRIRTASIVFSTRLSAPSMLQSLLHRPLFPLSRSRSSQSSSRVVRRRDMSITTGEHKARSRTMPTCIYRLTAFVYSYFRFRPPDDSTGILIIARRKTKIVTRRRGGPARLHRFVCAKIKPLAD